MKLSEDGTLSGTAVKEGKFPIQFTVTGSDNKRASKTLEFIVQAPNEEAKKPKDEPKKPEAEKGPADE